mmetsp:Transcript_81584/g.127370  ORF Transcript_81584/g.127370 Transcript_81584/m.127370 type:complete len:86 (+) Transcript_81584:867-1124(+)
MPRVVDFCSNFLVAYRFGFGHLEAFDAISGSPSTGAADSPWRRVEYVAQVLKSVWRNESISSRNFRYHHVPWSGIFVMAIGSPNT